LPYSRSRDGSYGRERWCRWYTVHTCSRMLLARVGHTAAEAVLRSKYSFFLTFIFHRTPKEKRKHQCVLEDKFFNSFFFQDHKLLNSTRPCSPYYFPCCKKTVEFLLSFMCYSLLHWLPQQATQLVIKAMYFFKPCLDTPFIKLKKILQPVILVKASPHAPDLISTNTKGNTPQTTTYNQTY
jgi:hypothetical protein